MRRSLQLRLSRLAWAAAVASGPAGCTSTTRAREAGSRRSAPAQVAASAAAEPPSAADAAVPRPTTDGGGRFKDFLTAFCREARAGDLAFLREHVAFPAEVRGIASEGVGNPRYVTGKLRSAREVYLARPCAGVEGLDPEFRDVAGGLRVVRTADGWTVTSECGQFDATLRFVSSPSGPRWKGGNVMRLP